MLGWMFDMFAHVVTENFTGKLTLPLVNFTVRCQPKPKVSLSGCMCHSQVTPLLGVGMVIKLLEIPSNRIVT